MLHERIKMLRHEKKLLQSDVANRFNVTKGAVGLWENGRRSPSISILQEMADFYGVTLEYLTGSTDNRMYTADKNGNHVNFSADETKLIKLFRKLEEPQKKIIMEAVTRELKNSPHGVTFIDIIYIESESVDIKLVCYLTNPVTNMAEQSFELKGRISENVNKNTTEIEMFTPDKSNELADRIISAFKFLADSERIEIQNEVIQKLEAALNSYFISDMISPLLSKKNKIEFKWADELMK